MTLRDHDLAALPIVENVRYRPRWPWEVERISEALLDEVPPDIAAIAARGIAAVRDHL